MLHEKISRGIKEEKIKDIYNVHDILMPRKFSGHIIKQVYGVLKLHREVKSTKKL